MPNIDDAVRFLIDNHSLELGESPRPSVDDEDQEVSQIDWDVLFPTKPKPQQYEEDQGFPYSDQGACEQLMRRVGAGWLD